ncbi:TPA: hypothetical protein ACXI4O_000547 [Pseudomonas aeruginosa]|uniref:hypothetical protein n=1 Tax=Pseudomonas aeruginosa TaxID=287 RepID=UPI0018E36AC0|nr:hypothetical protein [Pseudomonas aeruginosa]MBX5697141.1 hypothetical protein [Pseudomonas aeruginosa]MDA3169891.1 hypothetical protein [Pseudomonas aeruginosa]MDU0675683.1 hypothetical protein [Pseudomonas aeruginosa]QQD32635.1 hypothetical protein HUF09_11935 [Pseudomonas aeruginosa]UJB84217.1 hypothetical protein HUK64_02005 [Pseudomonas aeruginosa]
MSLGTVLFNNRSFDVVVCPGVQLLAIKAYTLPAYAEFADIWTHGLVELIPAHPEIGGRRPGPDNAWWARKSVGQGLPAGV